MTINTITVDYSIGKLKYFLYKRNLAIPYVQNVINLALYSGIQMGYREIFLHGIDSDGYKFIDINKNNEMIQKDSHFYSSNVRNLHDEGSFTRGQLYKRLQCDVNMFRSYNELSRYSNILNLKVINASGKSMVDSFERYDFEQRGAND